MSQREYRFAPAAEDDLTQHGNHLLKNISEAAMVDFFESFYKTCNLLAGLPYIGPKTEDFPDLREFGVRDSTACDSSTGCCRTLLRSSAL